MCVKGHKVGCFVLFQGLWELDRLIQMKQSYSLLIFHVNHIWIDCILDSELTLSNEDGIFQVGRRRVVIVHLVGNKNDEPGKRKEDDLNFSKELSESVEKKIIKGKKRNYNVQN